MFVGVEIINNKKVTYEGGGGILGVDSSSLILDVFVGVAAVDIYI